MKAIGTKQQNRSKRSAAVLFDNHAQAIQNLIECYASCDHFEKTLFTGEQRFPSLALANVYRGPDITIDLPGFSDHRPAHTLNLLNRSIRSRDPKLDVKTAFFANCFIETSLNKESIFRMDRFQE